MLDFLQNWYHQRLLKRARILDAEWRETIAVLPLLRGMESDELARLHDLASLFLHEKAIDPAGGLTLTQPMRVIIAVLACLPILNLGLDYYQDWRSIILYPAGFIAQHQQTDANGLVHHIRRPLTGEAWQRGPVILSWADIINSLERSEHNVLIHEMAHKLDMLNGQANGLPPLHKGMSQQDWSRAFNDAYGHLCQEVNQGLPTALNPYATKSPAEFLAVVSEAFFEVPEIVNNAYPAVYSQLQAFYRQDPLNRLPSN